MYDIRVDEELKKLLPPLTADEIATLTNQLKEHGYQTDIGGKILLWQPNGCNYYTIVDGHNRYRICQREGIPLTDGCFAVMDFLDKNAVIEFMIRKQLGERNLSDVDRYKLAERLDPILREAGKRNMSQGLSNSTKVNTRAEKARNAKMGESKYRQIDAVMNSDEDDLKEELEKGVLSANKAYLQLIERKKKPIEKDDIADIDEKLNQLEQQKKELERKASRLRGERRNIFDKVNCNVQYRIIEKEFGPWNGHTYRVVFYLEYKNHQTELCTVFRIQDESIPEPDEYRVPERYWNDFVSQFENAKEEVIKLYELSREREMEEILKILSERNSDVSMSNYVNVETDKRILLDVLSIAQRYYHPDQEAYTIKCRPDGIKFAKIQTWRRALLSHS